MSYSQICGSRARPTSTKCCVQSLDTKDQGPIRNSQTQARESFLRDYLTNLRMGMFTDLWGMPGGFSWCPVCGPEKGFGSGEVVVDRAVGGEWTFNWRAPTGKVLVNCVTIGLCKAALKIT